MIFMCSVGPNVVIGRKCEIAPDVLLNASSIGEGAKIGHYLLLSLCKRKKIAIIKNPRIYFPFLFGKSR